MYMPHLKFLVVAVVPVHEIIRVNPKNLAIPGYAHAHFSIKIYNGLLFGWTLRMYLSNFKFVALPVLR